MTAREVMRLAIKLAEEGTFGELFERCTADCECVICDMRKLVGTPRTAAAATLPCPCCGQQTASPGVRINAINSARAHVVDALEALRRIPGSKLDELEAAKLRLDAARERLAELECGNDARTC